MPQYECDKCGECCKGSLIVEADELDVMREPRLIDADRSHAGRTVLQVLQGIQDNMQCVIVACGSPCMFLGTDNACTIYPTRPNACVGMQPGDEQCQQARIDNGLPPLKPLA